MSHPHPPSLVFWQDLNPFLVPLLAPTEVSQKVLIIDGGMTAYHIWDAIATTPSLSALSHVDMKGADFLFPAKIDTDPHERSKMMEIMASRVRGFRRDAKVMDERGVDKSSGARRLRIARVIYPIRTRFH